MAINSINTNAGAYVALQAFNSTNTSLTMAQNQISTGMRVATATDNGAVWGVAQNMRGISNALGVVQDSLNRGISVVNTAVAAGSTISDLLNQMKAKALSATDPTSSSTDITQYANDFKAMVAEIAKITSTSNFNGINMINTGGTTVQALASYTGSVKITVAAANLTLGGATLGATFTANLTFTTNTTASNVLTLVNTAITNVNAAVGKLGTGVNALQTELSFVQIQTNTLNTGVGNLVDADVAAESAVLTSLQTKQQLGLQALTIANNNSSRLLSLFQG